MSTNAPSSAKSIEGVLEEIEIHQNGSTSLQSAQPVSDSAFSPRVSTVGTMDGLALSDSVHASSPRVISAADTVIKATENNQALESEVVGHEQDEQLGDTSMVNVPRPPSTVSSQSRSEVKEQHQMGYAGGQGGQDYSTPGLDALHWAGVKKNTREFDQRSIASSMAAERDDKSIYEEPTVGAVEEEAEEDVEQEQLSPLPSQSEIGLAKHNLIENGQINVGSPGMNSNFGRDASIDEIENASMYPNVSEMDQDINSDLLSPSEVNTEKQTAQDEKCEKEGGFSQQSEQESCISLPDTSEKFNMQNETDSRLSSVDPSSIAASPRSPVMPPSPISRGSGDFGSVRRESSEGFVLPSPITSKREADSAADIATASEADIAMGGGSRDSGSKLNEKTKLCDLEKNSKEQVEHETVDESMQSKSESQPSSIGASMSPSNSFPPSVAGSSLLHESRLPSQVPNEKVGDDVVEGESQDKLENEDNERDLGEAHNNKDVKIENETSIGSSTHKEQLQEAENQDVPSTPIEKLENFESNAGGEDQILDTVNVKSSLQSSHSLGNEIIEAELDASDKANNPDQEHVGIPTETREEEQYMEKENTRNSNDVENEAQIPAIAHAEAEAASTRNVVLEETPNGDIKNKIPRVYMGPEWEHTFRGLLYVDGVDSLGRPVVVINADAIPSNMRSSALTYVKTHLEPLVTEGHYVIVFAARKTKLPSFWIMGAYQSLPRPYRKNVQYVILVRPSGFLRAILAFMRPFVSKKAGKKVKLVDRLEDIAQETGGEVSMHHLGGPFLEADAAELERENMLAASAQLAAQTTAG